MVEIIAYADQYNSDFKRLNFEWLEKHSLIEQYDIDVLEDPQTTVIAPGGFIFLAKEDEEIIGSAGLAVVHEGEYELVKMAVSPAFRGRGVGKILMEQCLQKARDMNALKLVLFSSSKLTQAIPLYEKYGFKHIPVIDSPFVTADIKMELSL